MKHEWGKESYSDECTRKERMGIIWWKVGIWKLSGIWRGGGLREEVAPYVWGRKMLSTYC
jgi:hypothetical protein